MQTKKLAMVVAAAPPPDRERLHELEDVVRLRACLSNVVQQVE